MAATYSDRFSPLSAFMLFIVVLLGTPVLTLVVTPAPIFGEGENSTLWCHFGTQNLTLVENELRNLTLFVNGSIEEEVTLMFTFSGDKLLKEISNITLSPGFKAQTKVLTVEAVGIGHSVLLLNTTPPNMTDTSDDFVRISVSHTRDLDYFSDVVGWIYFVAWSISFYPQTYINWRRKSVIGLHFDFLSLNTLGFFMYSIFNICLYWAPEIKHEYFQRHPYGVNPVQLNDVIFSIHAFFACVVQVVQCLIYERGDQQVSKTAKAIFAGLMLASVVMVILGGTSVVHWLDFLYFVSYVKLFITLIKYIPQAYYNYRRKSTSGWSIGNILLDFTGGTLSIVQMFVIAYNYHDWSSIFGDPTKFGLGLFSVVFDVFFMIQHYGFYRGNDGYRRDLNSPQLTHSSSLTESVSSVDYGATGSSY